MTNPEGTPVWYELMTADPDAAKAFYDSAVGWTICSRPSGEIDYRMIVTADGSNAGGVMRLSGVMTEGRARPGWFFYIGVENVDASVARATAAGARVLIEAWTLEGVGRMAMLADPQGNPFYVMRGASNDTSAAFDSAGIGKCTWNELITGDQASALRFYGTVFGWTYPDRMPMGEIGDYVFINVAGTTIGAIVQRRADSPAANWRFYFRSSDLEIAADNATKSGGTVVAGPMEVPGGDRIIVVNDPEGVHFGIVGPAT